MRFSHLTYSLAGMTFCHGAVLFAFGPCLTSMADTFNQPVGRLGLIFTFFAVGLTPSVLVNGYLSEVTNRRPLLLGSIGGLALACALLSLIASRGGCLPLLLSVMVLMGYAAGGVQILMSTVVTADNQ